METNKKGLQIEEDNIFNQIRFRFLPYWPLFIGLLLVAAIGSFVYLRYATPVYDINATLLIKDEKKGLDDSRIMESLNIFSPNNIVENEMEVLQSTGLMKEVVNQLHLYAPVFSKGRVRSVPAYTSSPIIIETAHPDLLDTSLSDNKIYFTYDSTQKLVSIDRKNYPLNQWVNTPYGSLKFAVNPNLKTVTNKLLYFTLNSPKAISITILKNLQVTAPNKLSTIVNLTLKDENPKRGEDILNQLINVYDLAAINDKNEFSAKTLSAVTDRLKHVEHQVDSIQNLINWYKEKNGIVNLSEQSSLFLKSVGDNDQKITDINTQLAVLDDVEKYVNSKNSSAGVIPSTLGIDNPVLNNLLQKLYDLEISSQRLRATATDNNPALVSLRNDIEKTRADVLENTRIQRISLNAGRTNLNSTINTYSSQLKNIPDKEKELVEISRQLSVLNSTYDFLLQKKEAAKLSYESTVGNSRTVDKAESSIKPTNPQKPIVLLMAIALAMGMGFFVVLCKEFLSSKILFRSEIDKLTRIPVIGEIINLEKKTKKNISKKEKNTIVNEQFRQLAASAGFYGRKVLKNKILITSSISGEGKSFVSTNLASCLASSGKKVILIDFDFRNPQLSRTFDINEEIGISDFLEGEKKPREIIKSTGTHNLFVVATGRVEVERTNELLLNEEKLQELFNYLEEAFDFIILDTPPVEPISDAFILGEYCNCALYVVRHKYTPKSMIRLLDQNNKTNSLKNIAIVFNDVRPRGFVKHAYGYGYGFSYEYGYNQKKLKIVKKAG